MHAELNPGPPGARRLRWWPAGLIVGVLAGVLLVVRRLEHLPYQSRNLASLATVLAALVLLWVWWLLGSRAPWRWRLAVCGGVLILAGLGAAWFRIRGVSGDLVPILEPRWVRHGAPARGPVPEPPAAAAAPAGPAAPASRPDFPQFLGPERNGVITGVTLDPDWAAHPPQLLWRRPVGAAWSGFAVVGSRALTQEQEGDLELVTCYDLANGRRLWQHADRARYFTTLAGEGPRCTPTVVSNRVFALGATGILNCLDLADGRRVWSRSLPADARSAVPEWGFAGSPLVFADQVIVSAGGRDDHSALAYHIHTGDLVWHAGTRAASYSSPALLTLAGRPQVLLFNSRYITAHDPHSGQVLWEYPWGVGHPNVAQPVPVDSNRVVFSSGYGVGAELLEVTAEAAGRLAARRVWKSPRLKSKFANFVRRGEYLYGLDDGVLVCVAVRDGAQLWKEGRYGHGQMLLVDDRLLLMAENGELVLLQPTPEAPNERHRFRVFSGKTWNPPALAGDLLLVRNDREAACLRLAAAVHRTTRQPETTEEKPR